MNCFLFLKDAVIRSIEKKHRLEREALFELLQKEYGEDDVLIAENMTPEQRQEFLQKLMEKRRNMDIGEKIWKREFVPLL